MRRSAIVGLLLLGGAALAEDVAERSQDESGVAVAVAGGALPAGSILGAGDVVLTRVSADSPLAGAGLGREAVVGRTTADRLEPGEMITAGRLADPGNAPAGTTVMPVPFPESQVAEYLTAGTVLDVVWIPDEFQRETPRTVAEGAVVMPDPTPRDNDGTDGWRNRTVLLRVADSDAIELAAALGSGRLAVLLRSE